MAKLETGDRIRRWLWFELYVYNVCV